ncbi:hypothetical protein Tco_0621913 [Tanacetum coccineum]
MRNVTVETFTNISHENKAHFDAVKEAIRLLLTRIRDEINSTVDACKTAHDIHQGKNIAKPITPLSELASEEDSDLEQAQRDKDITSLNSKNKNVDTTPRYVNENQTGQFGNQRTTTGAGAKETVGSQYRKPKRAKETTYQKEKMLLYKQAEKGVPLQAEKSNWLEDTDEEIDEQELEAHYSFMAKIQEVLNADSGSDAEPLEKVQYDAEYNVFANERQHSEQPKSIHDTHADQNAEECDDERDVLANLISALEECKSSPEKSNRTRDRYLGALHDKEVELEKYKIFKDHTIKNDILERKLKETLGLLAQKEHDIQEEIVDQAWEKHTYDKFRAPTTEDMIVFLKTCLMPLALKTQILSFKFVSELKQEMFADLQYVQSLKKEIDKLESDKAAFLKIYDLLFQECVSKDVMCSYLHSLSDLDAHTEL